MEIAPRNSTPVVTVPRDAVILRQGASYVMRVRADNTAERVAVNLGPGRDNQVQIGGTLRAGDRVIVEQPSYHRTLLLLERIGAERIGVPLEADGIDVEELERATGQFPTHLVHVIPNFHNPAGCTLARGWREQRPHT